MSSIAPPSPSGTPETAAAMPPATLSQYAPPAVPERREATIPSRREPTIPARREPTIDDVLRERRMRLDGWTPARVAAFIVRLGETGSVTKAAACAGMTTASCYALRNRPGGEPFADAWESAISTRHETLADIAMDRVRDGVERIRWWRGQPVGFERVFSDRLLMFMLAQTDPERRKARAVPAAPADPAARAPAPCAAAHGADELATLRMTHGDAGERAGQGAGDAGSGARAAAERAAAELGYDLLSPEDEAMTAAHVATIEARKAAGEATIAAIGAALDAALGRPAAGSFDRQGDD